MSAFNTARGRGGDFGLPSLQDLGNLPLTLIFCNVAWLGWYWLDQRIERRFCVFYIGHLNVGEELLTAFVVNYDSGHARSIC